MYDILYLFKGMLVGLMVSIPLGPMGVLIIQKTLHKGALSGFIAGMGAASADFFYASVAAFGLGYVINTVQTHELLLQIIGGIFLLCIGLKIYFDNPIRQIRQRRQGRVLVRVAGGLSFIVFFDGFQSDHGGRLYGSFCRNVRFRRIFFYAGRVVGGDGGVVRRWCVVVHGLDFGKYLS